MDNKVEMRVNRALGVDEDAHLSVKEIMAIVTTWCDADGVKYAPTISISRQFANDLMILCAMRGV